MKKIMVLCLCFVLVFSLTACVSQPKMQEPEALPEPRMLVIATAVDLYNIDPAVGFDYALSSTSKALYDNLYRHVDSPPRVIPWLAERYEVSEDATEWTFYLRKDARFHDGSPVTAHAVKYSADRLFDIGKGPASLFMGVLDKDGVVVVDDYIVKFKLSKPFAPFIDVMPWLFVVNPGVVEEHRGDDFAQSWLSENEAGSGPFTISKWVDGEMYEFKAVEDYWKGWPEQGRLAGYRRLVIRDSSERSRALINGGAHLADWMLPEDQLLLRDIHGMVLSEEPGLDTYEIKLNNKKGYTSDVYVRRAVSYAMDYDALEKIWAGRAKLMNGPLPAGSEWENKELSIYRLDLVRARQELSKSPWPKGGFELDFVYVSGLEEERQTGLIVKNQLAKLNISVNVIPMFWADAVALFGEPGSSPDMFPLYSSTAYSDPDNYLWSGYHSSQAGQWTNPGHYENEQVDALLEQARGIIGKEQRKSLYDQAQHIIVEEAVNIFGLTPQDDHVFSPVLKGYDYCPIMGAYEEFYWFRIED